MCFLCIPCMYTCRGIGNEQTRSPVFLFVRNQARTHIVTNAPGHIGILADSLEANHEFVRNRIIGDSEVQLRDVGCRRNQNDTDVTARSDITSERVTSVTTSRFY
jgi:hypothetical protein